MIGLDFQPISLVKNKGFQHLLSRLEPRYTIPARNIFSNRVINDMYTEVVNKVKT